MTKLFLISSIFVLSSTVFSAPKAVEQSAEAMKQNDVRTIITEVENTDENPCMPEGKSYQAELQVKMPTWDGIKMEIIYSWETVKTIGIDKDGSIMEVCGE